MVAYARVFLLGLVRGFVGCGELSLGFAVPCDFSLILVLSLTQGFV